MPVPCCFSHDKFVFREESQFVDGTAVHRLWTVAIAHVPHAQGHLHGNGRQVTSGWREGHVSDHADVASDHVMQTMAEK